MEGTPLHSHVQRYTEICFGLGFSTVAYSRIEVWAKPPPNLPLEYVWTFRGGAEGDKNPLSWKGGSGTSMLFSPVHDESISCFLFCFLIVKLLFKWARLFRVVFCLYLFLILLVFIHQRMFCHPSLSGAGSVFSVDSSH